jgi:hypothetical protein
MVARLPCQRFAELHSRKIGSLGGAFSSYGDQVPTAVALVPPDGAIPGVNLIFTMGH